MNILSVDWDYFFPELGQFDWGADEKNNLFYDLIWYYRFNDKSTRTLDNASEVLQPKSYEIDKFFKTTCKNTTTPTIIIADRHMDIANFIINESVIYNFDQHHDTGYGNPKIELNSGNWVKLCAHKIREYHLHYPIWRAGFPETDNVNCSYGVPDIDYPDFDIIFVCRSSAFTPPWCDHRFQELKYKLMQMFPHEYHEAISSQYVEFPRQFDCLKAANLSVKLWK